MPTRPGDGPDADLLQAVLDADDGWLAQLVSLRPDLAQPAPSSLTALAQRAGSRGSCGRALASLPVPVTTVAEAVVVLDDGGPVTAGALGHAVGLDPRGALEDLAARALVLPTGDGWRPVRGLVEAVGPQPLGLGPGLAALDLERRDGWPTTPSALAQVLADAPEPAMRLLESLTWGPPVGSLGTTVPPSASWLLTHRVLHRSASTQVVLPREVALAARGGRLARDVAAEPPFAPAPVRRTEVVAAEVVRAADEVLRHLDVLLDRWAADPPGVLRGGGLAVRDTKLLSNALGSSTTHAAFVCELAASLELVGHLTHPDGSTWVPSAVAAGWRERSLPERWAQLATAWWLSPRTPWLAGSRSERGALRATLDPDLQRPWVAPLRRRVLAAVAGWPEGSAPTPEQVLAVLTWSTPRSAPPAAAVTALLKEASSIGVLGAGALSAPGRAVVDGRDGETALAALLPPDVEELVVQGDLTGVVPGRPSRALLTLLESCSDVDSRGAALTVRFSPESVARALDAGVTAPALLASLAAASRTPLPQPLEYLVQDTARQHGRLRVTPAQTVVHGAEDALPALLADPGLRHLGLRLLAPTVVVADAPPHAVHEALRATGAGAVLEGTDGTPVRVGTRGVRAVRPVRPRPAPTTPGPDPAELVVAMRRGEQRAGEMLAGDAPVSPSEALELLRTAAGRGSQVELVVAATGGRNDRRVVRPLSVEGGRVRVLDVDREAELTVASHRIVSVRPV